MTPDQEQLLKKSHKSLLAARILDREEMYDFSASRSYYAMFYAVQALLLAKEMSFSKHSAVNRMSPEATSGAGQTLYRNRPG